MVEKSINFNDARKLCSSDKYEEALEIIDKFIKEYPVDIEAQTLKMRILNYHALYLAKKGKYKEAIIIIKYVFELDIKSFTESYDIYGEILLLMGKYDEAISQLKKALENPPVPVETYYNLAVCYEKKHQEHNVLPYLHTVMELMDDESNYRKALNSTNFKKYKKEFIRKVKEMKSAVDWLMI